MSSSSSLPPRPKPWETPAPNATASSSSKPSAFDTALASTSSAPHIPERPAGLSDSTSSLATTGYGNTSVGGYQPRYGGYGMSGMSGMSGMNPYGGVGGYGGYGGMSRMGGMGGMGGYGYGSYGMGYGVGGMGAPGEPYNLTSSVQASTAPAFAVLESVVQAISSLAQLFESTYMATHSSFFAMVGVADQLGSLKTYLGQVLGVFSVLRLGRRILAWLRGSKVDTAGWANEWTAGGRRVPAGAGEAGRPSAKPLLMFLASAVGLPWLMSRLVRVLMRQQAGMAGVGGASNGAAGLSGGPGASGFGIGGGAGPGGLGSNGPTEGTDGTAGTEFDPTKLTFARATFEFSPSEAYELGLKRDEIVAVLERRDNAGQKGWWRGRTREGRVGWFPGNHVEEIKRRDDKGESDGR